MRILAMFCGAFSAGIFLSQYCLPEAWLLPCGAAAFALSGLWLMLPEDAGRRFLLCGTGFALALGWQWLYVRNVAAPARAWSGWEGPVEMRLCGYGEATAIGARAEVEIPGLPGRLVYYGGASLLSGVPGQVFQDTVRLQYAGRIRESEISTFVSQGVFLLAYHKSGSGTSKGEDGPEGSAPLLLTDSPLPETTASPRWWPVRAGRTLQDNLQRLYAGDAALFRDTDAAAFLSAMLTGERSGLSEQASADLSEAGLSHLLAVSGMHCGFLAALVRFLLGRRRRLSAVCAIPILYFYAAMTGGKPSAVRACIMLTFFLAAPLFYREGDAPTSLAAALCAILLQNPFAARSLSLQLSFGSVAGLLWITPGIYRWLSGGTDADRTDTDRTLTPASTSAPRWGPVRGFFRKAWVIFRKTLAASAAASVGVLCLAAPLSLSAFGVLSLAAPLGNLLCLGAAAGIFILGFLAAAVSFLSPGLASLLAVFPGLLIRYVLTVAHVLALLPGHAVYGANPFLPWWLLYTALLFGYVWFVERRNSHAQPTGERVSPAQQTGEHASHAQPTGECVSPAQPSGERRSYGRGLSASAVVLSAACLLLVIALARRQYRSALDVVMLDAGQGQCIVLASAGQYAMLDCGGSGTMPDVGAAAAGQLRTMGCTRLDALLLTHYDSDHVSGLAALLARVPVREALLPPFPDDDRNQAEVLRLLQEYHVPVRRIQEREVLPFGAASLTVFPPVSSGDDNDRGLSFLASAGDADLLVTGDMGQSAERVLLNAYSLPDLEAFVAGHHGSKYSTSSSLLDALSPEVVLISVGSNSYGHPAGETLDRLEEHGCAVYRTDRDGDLWLAMNPSGKP